MGSAVRVVGYGSRSPVATGVAVAPWLLALAFAHPLLLWPLIEGVPLDPNRDFASGAVDQPSGPLNVLYFPPLAALAVALWLRQRAQFIGAALRFGPWLLVAFLAWAALSTTWSVEPAITLRRVMLQTFIVMTVALPAMVARDARAPLVALFWVLCLAAVVNVLPVATMPPTALGHAGIYPHKNELGVVAAMMVLLGLWALKAGSRFERLTALPLVALGIVFLIASRSKTSLGLAVLAPLLAAAALSGRHWLRVSPALSVPGALATAFLVYWAGAVSWVWDFHAVANALFGDPTLTLRTDIWSFAYEMAGARPLTGYGYEVFWGAGPSSPNQIYGEGFVRKVVHAHNGYLDTVVHLGLVGLAIVLVMMLDALLQAGRRFCSEPGAAFGQSTLLVFLMLYNLLEVTWFRSFSITSMAFVAIVASVVLVPPKPVGRLFRVADFKRYRWVPASAA